MAAAAPETRQIVLAGPGAGKSEVVGELCRRLVIDHGIYPDEILVISFSNAAVDVVRRRTRDVVDEGVIVAVSTIDALAARVRSEIEFEESPFTGYDDAIVKASRLMAGRITPVLPDIRHVVVDEVQDVVGVRAEFVLELLARGVADDVGFTLLGDPMQSLYDFQIDSTGDWTNPKFLDAVRAQFGPIEINLVGEYRARSDLTRAVSRARTALLGVSATEQLLDLQDLAAELPPLGDLDEDAAADIEGWAGTTALLCDTNARAGITADMLSGLGVPTELAPGAQTPALDPWLGHLLAQHPTSRISFAEFTELAATHGIDDPDHRWRSLISVARSPSGLDIPELSHGLRQRRIPSSLLRRPSSPVIASTVHRAKGLEFDNVVLVDPESWRSSVDDDDATARRLFVAMSRGRSRLTIVRGASTKWWRKDERDGIWIRTGFRGRGLTRVLLEPQMARALGPVTVGLASTVGREVEWEPTSEHVTVEGDEVPSWLAVVDGTVVARTGTEFGAFIARRSYRGGRPLLRGGRVEGLETLVGTPDEHPGGVHGLWLGARISGVVSTEWE